MYHRLVRLLRVAVSFVFVLLAMGSILPSVASAAEVMLGLDPDDHGEPITLAPDPAAGLLRNEAPMVSGEPALWIRRMPVDKTLRSVRLSAFMPSQACEVSVYLDLEIREYSTPSSTSGGTVIGKSMYPSVRRGEGDGVWALEEPVDLEKGKAYGFVVTSSGAAEETSTEQQQFCKWMPRIVTYPRTLVPDPDEPACVEMPFGREAAGPRLYRVWAKPPVGWDRWAGTDATWTGPTDTCSRNLKVKDVPGGVVWAQVSKHTSGGTWSWSSMATVRGGYKSLDHALIDSRRAYPNGCDVLPTGTSWASTSSVMLAIGYDGGIPITAYPFYGCMWAGFDVPGKPDALWWEALPRNAGWPFEGERLPNWPQTMRAVLDPATYAPGEQDPREIWGGKNPGAPKAPRCDSADPVNCATGNFYEDFQDLALPAPGGETVAVTRTYNSQAASAGVVGIFGRGWSTGVETRVEPLGPNGDMIVIHANGSTVPFALVGGQYVPPKWVQSSLVKLGDGYDYELPDHTKYRFNLDGRLVSSTNLNGVSQVVTWVNGKADKILSGLRSIQFTYGTDGRVATVADGTGRTVRYTYTGDRLTNVRDVGAKSTKFTYDAEGRMLTRTDPRGAVTTNEYEGDRVKSQTDAEGKATRFEYQRSTTGSRTKVTDRDGVVTMHRFAHLLPVSVTRGYGTDLASTVKSSFNERSLVDRTIDPSGARTRYKYDARGNTTVVTDAEGRATTSVYNALDLPTEIRTPAGRITELTYDAKGNVTRSVERGAVGEERLSIFTYDSRGQLLSEENGYSGRRTTYEYDALGNLIRQTAPGARVTEYGYDLRGGLTLVTKPSGLVAGATKTDHQLKYARDLYGAVTSSTDELGTVTTYTYDATGNLLDTTDPDGRKTSVAYDLLGRTTSQTRGDGGVDRWTYTGEGQIASSKNGLDFATSYTFDDLGRPKTEKDPLGRVSTTLYDAAGNVSGVNGPDGKGPRMTFDKTGRLTQLTHTDGTVPATTYQYDLDGYLTRTESGADTVAVEWDSQGRVRSRTRDDGTVTRLNWGVGGDLESIDYPEGADRPSAGAPIRRLAFGSVKYTYNAAGDMVGVKDFANRAFSFTYDANGELATAAYPQGALSITRDRVGRPLSIGTPVGNRSYTYSPGGVPSTSVVNGGAASALTVDGGLHLKSFGTRQYAVDQAERPTSLADFDGTAVAQTFDAAGQAKDRGVGATATKFTFDEYGRRTRETLLGTGVDTATFAYDAYGRLTTLTARDNVSNAMTATTMAYGPDGTRRSTTRSGLTRWESWEDGLGGNALLLAQGREAYVYGPGGLALERVLDGDAKYLWQDAIGSVIGATNLNGSTAGTVTYDPWGRRLSGATAPVGSLGFAGQVTEAGGDYQFLRARYYDPRTAQFLSRDPLEPETGQPYLYAAGNPTMFTDPSGESFVDSIKSGIKAGRDFLGGVAHGVTFGKYKPGWADSCSWWYFGGGFTDPLKKVRAAALVLRKAAGLGGIGATAIVGRVRSAGGAARTDRGRDIVGTSHDSVRPTQDYVRRSQVEHYERALRDGTDVRPIQIQRMTDGRQYILDGHHRYAASQRAGIPVRRSYIDGDGPVGMPDWSDVSYVDGH